MKNFTTLTKESFEIYKQKIKSILSIATILLGLEIILSSCLGYLLVMGKTGDVAGSSSSFIYLLLGIILLTIVCSIFIVFSFFILTIKPAATKLKEIFQEAWKKLWQYFWIGILLLLNLFIISSSLWFIIPGVVVLIYLIFCFYILIIEEEKGMNALKRSWNLVKGNWWKVFGRIILLNIIIGAIYTILISINDLLGGVFQCFSMPFGIIFMYLIYLELKESKEIQASTPIEIQKQV